MIGQQLWHRHADHVYFPAVTASCDRKGTAAVAGQAQSYAQQPQAGYCWLSCMVMACHMRMALRSVWSCCVVCVVCHPSDCWQGCVVPRLDINLGSGQRLHKLLGLPSRRLNVLWPLPYSRIPVYATVFTGAEHGVKHAWPPPLILVGLVLPVHMARALGNTVYVCGSVFSSCSKVGLCQQKHAGVPAGKHSFPAACSTGHRTAHLCIVNIMSDYDENTKGTTCIDMLHAIVHC